MTSNWSRFRLGAGHIVLLSSGVLLGLNVSDRIPVYANLFTDFPSKTWHGQYGWPIGFESLQPPDHLSFLIDVVINLTLLLMIGVASEHLLRRKKG
jgi:hypothetical protein